MANDAYRGTMTGGREGFCRNSRSRNTLRPLVTAAAVHCDPLGRGLCRARWARALPAAWSKLLMGAASPHLDDYGVLPLRKAALLHSRVQVVPPPAGMPGVRGGRPGCYSGSPAKTRGSHRSLQLLPERPRTFSATTDHFCGPYMATSLRSCSSSCEKHMCLRDPANVRSMPGARNARSIPRGSRHPSCSRRCCRACCSLYLRLAGGPGKHAVSDSLNFLLANLQTVASYLCATSTAAGSVFSLVYQLRAFVNAGLDSRFEGAWLVRSVSPPQRSFPGV